MGTVKDSSARHSLLYYETHDPSTENLLEHFKMKPFILKGWRFGVVVGALVGAIGIAIYPIIISPMMDPEPYKRLQGVTRVGIDQDKIQPGNMKVWSDPFDRPKER